MKIVSNHKLKQHWENQITKKDCKIISHPNKNRERNNGNVDNGD